MKKISALLILISSFSVQAQDAPDNMVCKLKNNNLNTCLDVSNIEYSKKLNEDLKKSPTKVYRVKQENGIWSYSANPSVNSEELDLKSERMTKNVTYIKPYLKK